MNEQLTPQRDYSDLLIIDGDAIPFMIGWHHREHDDAEIVRRALKS